MVATRLLKPIARLFAASLLILLISGPVKLSLGNPYPGSVSVGEPFTITVSAETVGVAGFEGRVRYDPEVVRLRSLTINRNPVNGASGVGAELGPYETPVGVVFGAFRCSNDCSSAQPARESPVLPAETLAAIELVALVPGIVELVIDRPLVFGSDGLPLPLNDAPRSLMVRVGAPSAGEVHPAPAISSTQTLPRQLSDLPPRDLDLSGDGRVSAADSMEIALAWAEMRLRGDQCGAPGDRYDLNQDGCMNVGDLLQTAICGGLEQSACIKSHPDPSATAALWTVTSTGDGWDSSPGNGQCATSTSTCTLRAAIQEANARPGPDTIAFALPGSGVRTIQLTSTLPSLSDESGGTTIDGYTQAGAAPNSDPHVSNALIRVQIRGNGHNGFDALPITSANNTVRGVAIFNMRRGLYLYGSGAHDNVVSGNFIGTDARGEYHAVDPAGHTASGIAIEQGASQNTIGGPALADRNVISGNAWTGLTMHHLGTSHNRVINNIVGLRPDGSGRLANVRHGVDINYAASHNRIGGSASERNIISGNNWMGVDVSHGQTTAANEVLGNYIGTDAAGNHSAPFNTGNGRTGIRVYDGVTSNVIAGNIVSNNAWGGIYIEGAGTDQNHIYDNHIVHHLRSVSGADVGYGIEIAGGASHTLIGPDNTIAHNAVGINIVGDESDFNTVSGNSIYENSTLGIDLAPAGVNPNNQYPATGPNQRLNFPVITGGSSAQLTGTACAGCLVELFEADGSPDRYGQGYLYIGSARASSSGTFTASVTGLNACSTVTATATDANGNTSEFSRSVQPGSCNSIFLPLASR